MYESTSPTLVLNGLEVEQQVQREYVIFGAAEAQARILTCFNNYFERWDTQAICLPSLTPHKLMANAVASVFQKPQIKGVAFARPQAVSECPPLSELNDDAVSTQVVSAIRKLPDGRLSGALFDGVGLVARLEEQNQSFKGLRILMLGAGPQSCAVALVAVKHGAAHLDLLDPRQYLAQSLVSQLRGLGDTSLGTEPRLPQYDVVVNTWESNAMMQQSMLLGYLKKLGAAGWAVDTGLSLESSMFLKLARSLGIHIFSGIPSLRSQVRYYLDFFGELPTSKSSITSFNL